VLTVGIRSSYVWLIVSGSVFVIALAACWFNSLAWPFKAAMSMLVVGVGFRYWYPQDKITRLNLTADSCFMQVNAADWMPAELAIHYRDSAVVVLKLRCVDPASPNFRHVYWLWLCPGLVSSKEQRRLRSFLANEFNARWGG
jgi:hypothetical protein